MMKHLAFGLSIITLLQGSGASAQQAPSYKPPQPQSAATLPAQPSASTASGPSAAPPDEEATPAPSNFGEAPPEEAITGPRQARNFPVIGAKRLLQSLSDLNRPLSPEEVTAYGAALQSVMPMSPELIRNFRQRVDESQKAAALPPSGVRAEPISDAVRMSLSTRQPLQTLLTTPNSVSVMAFYDRTGKAWPIASFVVGRADSFQVYALQEGSNQLAVTPIVSHGYSNLVISLVEEDRPIVINLETSDTKTNVRRDITVEGYGPNADLTPATVSPKAPPSDQVMMAFAEGAALPDGATKLSTSESGVEAWSFKGDLYLRTSAVLTSPPSSSLTGPGGVHAYRLKETPVALISRGGTITRVRISR